MWPKEGRKNALDHIFRDGDVIYVRLVKTDITGTADDDMTRSILIAEEADYPGYAAINLAGTLPAANLDGADRGLIDADPITFQPSGMSTPQTIYGYFVEKGTGPQYLLIWRRFSTPQVMASDASELTIDMDFLDDNFTP